MQNFTSGFRALVFGATGGIGAALVEALQREASCAGVTGLSRTSDPAIQLESEASIAAAAQALTPAGPFALMIDATGALTLGGRGPEKRLADLDASHLLAAFAVNAVGPALLLKHFTGLLPRREQCVFATLSARVGSIGDNRLGGWYGYRASKAALNQLWRCGAIEVARTRPGARLLCLQPGTVATRLSSPYAGPGGDTPASCAQRLLAVIDAADASGVFLDQNGRVVPW